MGVNCVSSRIEDYALIGDMQTAALVGRDGSVDWLCLPHFDSPACFAALLGDEQNGNWWIRPATGTPQATRRRYRHETLILESEWDTPEGTVRVIDFMPPRSQSPHMVRIVEGVRGTVRMNTALRLRYDYGNVVPWIHRNGTEVVAVAGPDSVWISSPIPLEGHNFTHDATFTVSAGQRVPFVLTWHPSHHEESDHLDAEKALSRTERFWRQWVDTCTYDGRYRDAVVRSLITLKALTYRPTGGIVAAPTASLPEEIGGVRNWDYRYCWLRDATITLEALMRSGYTEEAAAWREWLVRAVAGEPQRIQIMYGIRGERRLSEWEADWLPGYEGSRPVRIGNAAVGQYQLDVYGEVMDVLHLARLAGLEGAEHVWGLQRSLVNYLEWCWDEPDEGLWEVRGPRQHFVHSKVMAWVAADRAVRMIEEFGREGPVERWRALRDTIHAEVCEYGYDARRNTFTQYYGSEELDAALLLIPEVGFLPYDDPRVVGTIEAVRDELMVDGFVHRYRADAEESVDGLPGGEGAFLACSFWMANALLAIGREREARDLFDRLLALRNDVGLLSEEYDAKEARMVGNFPQAFSHVPLVTTALNLSHHDGHRRAEAC
ncbi:glycoside hydrolase family 15 protein [Lipingzhangella sp. LS1_29]|uniref:Glycoside hydrolase family 15 protein n=1 Tax=Lipingzhangella rawalii TaxID=2055835 RepID=A0ABU2H0Q0_9ACTN|nr:glycoside hydrolase family 15 protein [Lipingzhangella rawalii]MDS1268881.1 glycoside hydrolase family 15 protein [Lipingzhangella rawalii]